MPCTQYHLVEETYIGRFSGAVAASVSPPVSNSVGIRSAYAQCAAPTRAYIGGDWHAALLALQLTVPDSTAWHSGARWFRCELSEIPSADDITPIGADMSFRGMLSRSTPLSAHCITWQMRGRYFTNITAVPCRMRHNGEFVGAYTAPVGPWPSTVKKKRALADDGCEQLVARFVGFPSWQRLDNPHIGEFHMDFNESQWGMGDRSVRCYAAAATDDGTLVGSVKGIKTRKPQA